MQKQFQYVYESAKFSVILFSPYRGCFTTLEHNCRRWFPRSLWWKNFI